MKLRTPGNRLFLYAFRGVCVCVGGGGGGGGGSIHNS